MAGSNASVTYLQDSLYPSWFKRSGPPSEKGSWPTISRQHVASFRGNWPTAPTHETVKSSGPLPPSLSAPSDDGWLEIGQPYFRVIVDGKDLGFWVKLDGLGMKVDVAEHRTGDGYNYRWIEPTISEFPNIKLSRAATAKGCGQSLAWLMHAQYAWKKGMTAVIQAKPLWHRATEEAWFNIGLADVMPVGWSGPALATDGKIAMETLELAFSGFLPPKNASPQLTVPPPYNGRKEPTPAAPPPAREFAAVYKPTEKTAVAPTR